MAAAAPLILAATGLSAGASIIGGIQQQQAGKENQAIANTEATQAQQEASSQAQEQGIQTQQLLGRQIAAAGASGVDPDQGSPVNVAAFTAQQGKLQQELTLYKGTLQANQFKQQGALQAWQGNQALVQGIVKAGTTALLGYNTATNPLSPSSGIGSSSAFSGSDAGNSGFLNELTS